MTDIRPIGTDRGNRHTWLLVMALALSIGSCSLTSPGRSMSLVGTTWNVVEIGTEAVSLARPPQISFLDSINTSIWTGCRTETAEYALDTDGEALSFEVLAPSPDKACGPAAAVEEAFLDALASVEQWSIENPNRIRFIGLQEIVLRREVPEA
jgi:heat shock protein HslJ